MIEYIPRQAAIAAVIEAKMPDTTPDGIPIANGKRSVSDCIRRIRDIPAVDVRYVGHGKWLNDYKMPTCSICGNAVPFPDQYCSNCGSKMDLDIADYVAERGRENG